MAKRAKYSDEFKREAIKLTQQPGSGVSQVARNIGVSTGQLFRWRRELAVDNEKPFPGNGVARDQEMLALKRELATVKKERDFLRDAAAFFAKGSS